ncbi:hypothetical protein, partial [Spirochaeta lutea]|uniref:hypothetical protein n=1 Tax=Spirochaeta lutea TaxID=1480694 RepID=UPI00138DD9B8
MVIQIFAIDPVQFEIIQRFPNGTGPGEFRYHSFEGMGANPSSPEILAYEDGEFFIGDNVNNRMVKIGRNREWNILYTGWIPEVNLIPAGKFLVGLNLGSVYDVYDRETRRLLHTGEVNLGNAEFFFFSIIAGDMLFVQPHSGGSEPQYYGFFIPEDFDGKITMMDPERTIDFLKNDYDGTEEFTVDEEGYIFWDGKLVAPYGPTYYRYYYKTRDNNPTLWNAMQQRGFIG